MQENITCKENDLFNYALNSFYLQLYGVWHMVVDHLMYESIDSNRYIDYLDRDVIIEFWFLLKIENKCR